MLEYRTTEQNAHLQQEYLQWARILSHANPVHGMLVVFVQKLCTAFHEFAPAWQNGVLNQQGLDFFRQRLSARTRTVLDTLVENDLGAVDVAGDFRQLLEADPAVQKLMTSREFDSIFDYSYYLHEVDHIFERAGLTGSEETMSGQTEKLAPRSY